MNRGREVRLLGHRKTLCPPISFRITEANPGKALILFYHILFVVPDRNESGGSFAPLARSVRIGRSEPPDLSIPDKRCRGQVPAGAEQEISHLPIFPVPIRPIFAIRKIFDRVLGRFPEKSIAFSVSSVFSVLGGKRSHRGHGGHGGGSRGMFFPEIIQDSCHSWSEIGA